MEHIENLGIIPARYGSTRFPGKPLIDIGGVTMIERVYRQASQSQLNAVLVATDDSRIADEVARFGGWVVRTSPDCPSGTDRCREALDIIGWNCENVINIQGDEPFIDPEQINQVLHLLHRTEVGIATLVSPAQSAEEVLNPNRVKAVTDYMGRALYFSRSPIPYDRTGKKNFESYLIHLGIYGFKADVLADISELSPGVLEGTESLEQLRWLENGYAIYTDISSERADSIDTPEDLRAIKKKLLL